MSSPQKISDDTSVGANWDGMLPGALATLAILLFLALLGLFVICHNHLVPDKAVYFSRRRRRFFGLGECLDDMAMDTGLRESAMQFNDDLKKRQDEEGEEHDEDTPRAGTSTEDEAAIPVPTEPIEISELSAKCLRNRDYINRETQAMLEIYNEDRDYMQQVRAFAERNRRLEEEYQRRQEQEQQQGAERGNEDGGDDNEEPDGAEGPAASSDQDEAKYQYEGDEKPLID